MGMEVSSGYCEKCSATRKVERSRPSHLLHLVLTILTGGIWLLVWIGVSIQFGGWRCSTCGSTKVSKVEGPGGVLHWLLLGAAASVIGFMGLAVLMLKACS